MLKFARPGSGEDWSEKLAYEIGREIGVPCPRVDLAVVDQQHATLCWDFLGNREGPGEPVQNSLVHGNELLSRVDPSYRAVETYRVSQHTVEAVHNVLQRYQSPLGLSLFSDISSDAFDAFVGYLMLDALIGNTDRHHENWGVVVARKGGVSVYRLAPSYDHASSLGRELRDEKRRTRLQPSGRGTVADYADKAVSAFWDQASTNCPP